MPIAPHGIDAACSRRRIEASWPACDILSHVDGRQSVADLVGYLLTQYPEADAAEIEQDVLGLLERLRQRGVIRV